MTSIFFIGITGHVGGAVVEKLTAACPEVQITGLFRTEEGASRFTTRFPAVKAMLGHLGSLDLIEGQSKKASIVINCAPDIGYSQVTDAIARGLAARPSKGFYIHTSGAALIWEQPGGSACARIWDDVTDIEAIKTRPPGTAHRDTDDRVRSYAATMNVAIIAPTYVYGLSPSTEHPTFLTLPDVVSTMRTLGSGFMLGPGENKVSFVHAMDVASLYVALVKDALGRSSLVHGAEAGSTARWGVDAYYFGSDEEITFREFMEAFVPLAKKKGIVDSEAIQSLGAKGLAEAAESSDDRKLHEWSDHIIVMFGTNMRCRGSRGRQLLSYEPKEIKVAESLPETLDVFLERAQKI